MSTGCIVVTKNRWEIMQVLEFDEANKQAMQFLGEETAKRIGGTCLVKTGPDSALIYKRLMSAYADMA
jgi:hypothetical protein